MKFQNKKPLGYISGFVTVLVLWFFEHCQVVTPSSTTATPRMMRWGKAVAWSTIRCADIFASLEQHQVFERFQEVSEDELGLLATEENIPSDIIIDNESATVLITIQEALDTNIDMKVITKNNDVEDEDGNPKDHVDVEIEQENVAWKDNESVDVEIDQNKVAFKNNESIDVEIEQDKGHHEMKRSFPWEEAVTISDSDSEEDKQDRAKRDKKDCSSENLKDITSEGTLIRMAGMYQEYMKRIPIPTFSGSIVPFTSWQGLAKSLKQLYGQPLHYLTNALLKQWDRERFGSDNEHQPLDAVVHPVKAQTLIWLTEELHRLTASPYHLAKLWACDPMYHSQIDPFLSY